jgi:hypothetical protein
MMLFGLQTEGENRVLKNLKMSTFHKHHWGSKARDKKWGECVVRMGTLINTNKLLKQMLVVRNEL